MIKCPYCEKDNQVKNQGLINEGEKVYHEFSCANCGGQWSNVFKFEETLYTYVPKKYRHLQSVEIRQDELDHLQKIRSAALAFRRHKLTFKQFKDILDNP